MKKILIITGLTASGKSGLALDIAQKHNGEIISCDSVQVYKGLDIGSAKVTKQEQSLVKHHLIDIVEPFEDYSVGAYIKDCKKAVDDVVSRGKLPIIVGGTSMYIKAILEGYSLGGKKDEEYRKHLNDIATSQGKEAVWNILDEIDTNLAKTVHYNNLNRVIRYLEMKKNGEPKKEKPVFANFDILTVGINADKDKIYPKINDRVDEMISSGLVEEVKGLIASGLNLGHNSMNTIGYKEMYQHLNNEIEYDTAINLIKQHTRNYAKRQLTFMKTIKGLQIVDLNQAKILIEEFLSK